MKTKTENKQDEDENGGAVRDCPNSSGYAFNVREKVWGMHHNKPKQGVVYEVLLKPEYGAKGKVLATYLIYFSDSLCSVSEDKCVQVKEKDLARSKDELLEKIFSA